MRAVPNPGNALMIDHMAERVEKFNNWLNLMGSHESVSVKIDLRTNTIVRVEVCQVPAEEVTP